MITNSNTKVKKNALKGGNNLKRNPNQNATKRGELLGDHIRTNEKGKVGWNWVKRRTNIWETENLRFQTTLIKRNPGCVGKRKWRNVCVGSCRDERAPNKEQIRGALIDHPDWPTTKNDKLEKIWFTITKRKNYDKTCELKLEASIKQGTNNRCLDWPSRIWMESRWRNKKKKLFTLLQQKKMEKTTRTVFFSQKILCYPLFFYLHQIPTLLTVYNEKLSVSTNYISSEFLFPVLFKLYCCKLAMKSN